MWISGYFLYYFFAKYLVGFERWRPSPRVPKTVTVTTRPREPNTTKGKEDILEHSASLLVLAAPKALNNPQNSSSQGKLPSNEANLSCFSVTKSV